MTHKIKCYLILKMSSNFIYFGVGLIFVMLISIVIFLIVVRNLHNKLHPKQSDIIKTPTPTPSQIQTHCKTVRCRRTLNDCSCMSEGILDYQKIKDNCQVISMCTASIPATCWCGGNEMNIVIDDV